LEHGEVSVDHLRSLAKLTPATVAELLPHATALSADEFRRTVTHHKVKAASSSVSEEQHASRSVRFFRKRNGCVGETIVLPPIEGTEFANTVQELCDQAWMAAHPERAKTLGGHHGEAREQRLADALVTWMRTKTLKLGKPAVIITIDADTLDAELQPHQPIPLDDALKAMARADVFAAIRDGTKFRNLRFGRNKRVATALQRLALLVDQPTCVYPGCSNPGTQSDAHHIIEWDDGGLTDIDNLCYLCEGHHRHLHLNHQRIIPSGGGWEIADGKPCSHGPPAAHPRATSPPLTTAA
jgi:hypothetical protein